MMTFPVYFDLMGIKLHAHLAMELIAYAGGFQFYLWLRRRAARSGGGILGTPVPFDQNMWILVGCVFGALFGSTILAWIESANVYWPHRHELAAWLGGKTIVGGLLGGWIGVEIAKWRVGVKRATGDLFVFPLIFGMAAGRVGCFLTGLDDHTYGTPTTLPWGIDFGDHVLRHPTQLYEIAFLAVLGLLLWNVRSANRREGALFRLFMAGYLAMRFSIEFIKPSWKPYLGTSAIQLACLIGFIICAVQLKRMAELNPDRKFSETGATA
jgi:phosphatidylglycerol:prolipoprotein diacylglycerol transferase